MHRLTILLAVLLAQALAPSLPWLRKSKRAWKSRLGYRRAQLVKWQRRRSRWYRRWQRRMARLPEDHPRRVRAYRKYQRADDYCDKWEGLVDEARFWLRTRRSQIDVERAKQEDKASEHFLIEEFDCKDGTAVPRSAYPAVRRLAREVLEPMRDKFGRCGITSGYRTRPYNADIGGASQSQHIYDDSPDSVAADAWFERGTPAQWADEARRLGIGGVGQYNRSGFVHVDNGPRRDWWG